MLLTMNSKHSTAAKVLFLISKEASICSVLKIDYYPWTWSGNKKQAHPLSDPDLRGSYILLWEGFNEPGKVIGILENLGALPAFPFVHEMEWEKGMKGRTQASYPGLGVEKLSDSGAIYWDWKVWGSNFGREIRNSTLDILENLSSSCL